jgi:hypothetical protein
LDGLMSTPRAWTRLLALALCAIVFAAACSSSAPKAGAASASRKKDSGAGVKVLDAVVVERSQGGPSKSTGYSGNTYFLVFEAHEGDATARYSYEVTRQQWFRYQEGARVKLTLNNNILQDIEPGTEP